MFVLVILRRKILADRSHVIIAARRNLLGEQGFRRMLPGGSFQAPRLLEHYSGEEKASGRAGLSEEFS
jgi:hypothetical protein